MAVAQNGAGLPGLYDRNILGKASPEHSLLFLSTLPFGPELIVFSLLPGSYLIWSRQSDAGKAQVGCCNDLNHAILQCYNFKHDRYESNQALRLFKLAPSCKRRNVHTTSAGIERSRGAALGNARQLIKLRAEIHNKPSTPLDFTLHLLAHPSSHNQARNSSNTADDMPHALQGWFGIQDFITLVPTNYSQHFVNDEVCAPCLPCCIVPRWQMPCPACIPTTL